MLFCMYKNTTTQNSNVNTTDKANLQQAAFLISSILPQATLKCYIIGNAIVKLYEFYCFLAFHPCVNDDLETKNRKLSIQIPYTVNRKYISYIKTVL